MRRYTILLLMVLSGSAVIAQESSPARPSPARPSWPEVPSHVAVVQFKLPPDMFLGEAPGVATNSKGHIFVFTRTGNNGPARGGQAAHLWEFMPDGKFIREIGKNLYGFQFAHVVRIDKNDNIWAVDEGTNMVIEFNQEAQVMLVLGRRLESIDYLEEHLERGQHPPQNAPPPVGTPGNFNRPTDVAWDSAGNIYISDGYNNSRVAKFDKIGNPVKSWGVRGKEPGNFNTPHAIAIDNQDRIYVGDRGNNRVQVFDTDGKFITQYQNIGGGGICIPPGPNPNQIMYVAGNMTGILRMKLDGTILGLVAKPGRGADGVFAHSITCMNENEVWVGENPTWHVKKVTVKP